MEDESMFELSSIQSGTSFAFTSTPRSTSRRGRRPALFKPPQPVFIATCPRCAKTYKTLKYYERHLQTHKLKDAASRVPDVELLRANAPEIGSKALIAMMRCPSTGKWGPYFNQLVQQLSDHQDGNEWKELLLFLCEKFTLNLEQKSILLPSSITSSVLSAVEHILSDFSTRFTCMELLSAVPCCPSFDSEVRQFFLCDFSFKFCDEFLILLSRNLRNAPPPDVGHVNYNDVTIDVEDRQTIHFVAGSVIKGFLRMGHRHSKNKTWQAITAAIRGKLVENEDVGHASESDRMWTEMTSRGALTFVSKDALEFFVCVSKILIALEYKDQCALPHDSVLQAVFSGEAKYMWDSIIGNVLSEDLSVTLMKGVTKSFTQTYGRGVALKRINAVQKNQPYSSVTTRHRLAPR